MCLGILGKLCIWLHFITIFFPNTYICLRPTETAKERQLPTLVL